MSNGWKSKSSICLEPSVCQGQQSYYADVQQCSAELRRTAPRHDCGEAEDTGRERGEEVSAPKGEEAATGASRAELTSPPPLLSAL